MNTALIVLTGLLTGMLAYAVMLLYWRDKKIIALENEADFYRRELARWKKKFNELHHKTRNNG